MATADLLAEAKAALHDLVTGRSVRVVVDASGERVEFTPTNLSRLRSYITELEAEIAGQKPAPLGPMGIVL